MSKKRLFFVVVLVANLLFAISLSQPAGPGALTPVEDLTAGVLGDVVGGGFWSGLGCGLAIMGTAAAIASPDPFSKLAAAAYIGTAVSCGTMIYQEFF